MRGLFHPFSRAFPIVLIGLVLSAHLSWAQRAPLLEETTVQLPDAPSFVATVSGTPTNFQLAYRGLPLTFGQNHGRIESSMQFFPLHVGYDRLPELWDQDSHSIGSAQKKWMAFLPIYGQVHLKSTLDANDLGYFGHHLPGAGAIIMRICQQAKSHPHVTSVLKLVHPRF